MPTPLILLHGALGSQNYFEPLLSYLDDFTDVHTLNFEGHSQAEVSERPFRIEHFCENILDYMNERDIQQADFFGYSMGGYVALYLAHIGAQRVNRIFTLATKFAWTPEIAQREIRFLAPSTILQKVPQYAETLQNVYGDTWREVLAKTADMMISLGDTDLLADEVLANIQTPVRVGLGDRDKMVTFEESLQVYRQLPSSEFQILPQTPHPFDQMDVERVAKAIQDFFWS